MICLAFLLGGVAIGLVIAKIVIRHEAAHGHFYLEPYDNEDTGFYRINVAITPNQDLIKKDYIILEKDTSQK